jgi:hypothetical protein
MDRFKSPRTLQEMAKLAEQVAGPFAVIPRPRVWYVPTVLYLKTSTTIAVNTFHFIAITEGIRASIQ